jgi:hypothetical protein
MCRNILKLLSFRSISESQGGILLWSFGVLTSRDSSVVIAIGYGLEGRGVEFDYWYGPDFSPVHVFHTGSGAHTASYTMGIGDIFPGRKAARA